MKKKLSQHAFVLIVLFSVMVSWPALAQQAEPEQTSTPLVPEKPSGGTVTNFTLKDMDGNTFNLKDHLGTKVILLNFWATWCIPCRQEFPHLEKLHRKYGQDGFLMLAIDRDDASTRSRVKPFIKSSRYTFKVLLDTDSQVINRFNPKVDLPYSVLIDKKGNVVYQHDGYQAGDELKLEELIKKHLAEEVVE
ncbi:TlpA family protein disulfide reductase [bacterium]|nr:TlpA family protein disulfide reductase [bacterium]